MARKTQALGTDVNRKTRVHRTVGRHQKTLLDMAAEMKIAQTTSSSNLMASNPTTVRVPTQEEMMIDNNRSVVKRKISLDVTRKVTIDTVEGMDLAMKTTIGANTTATDETRC